MELRTDYYNTFIGLGACSYHSHYPIDTLPVLGTLIQSNRGLSVYGRQYGGQPVEYWGLSRMFGKRDNGFKLYRSTYGSFVIQSWLNEYRGTLLVY